MAFIPVPNVAQVQCLGRVDGQLTVNDTYWEISGGGITPTNLAALVFEVSTWFRGSLAALLADDWTAERTVGVDLTSNIGPRSEISFTTPGGVAGEAVPNNVAACVSFRTGGRGRSARGRNFVPALPGSLVTLNTLDPAFISDLIGVYDELKGPGTFLVGWQWVVVSRFTAGAPRVAGVPMPVTEVVMVGDKVRSMRSREVGHGA
jgi:hypothetical protein